MPTPSAWQRSCDLLVLAQLRGGRAEHVEDLAPQRQERLGLAVARHLGGAAGAVALDDEEFGPLAGGGRAVDELAGQAQLLGGGLARGLLLLPAAEALLGAQDEEVEDRARRLRVLASQCRSGRAPRLRSCARPRRREAVLGLADEGGVAMKHRDQRAGAAGEILARDLAALRLLASSP
jgi:hypothetical protein